MRIKSPHAGRNEKGESLIDLNGFGTRGAGSGSAKVAIQIRSKPYNIDGWVEEISRTWKGGSENTLALARLLHRARRSMEHGQWSRLWRSERVPFSKRKAEMLVIVGQGLEEVNANNCAHLPSSWRTLYYLAQLGSELAERLIAQGRIHPRLQLRQARELLAEFKPESVKKASVSSPLEWRLDRFFKFVQSHAANWTPPERELFRAELKRFLKIVPSQSNNLMKNLNSHEHIEFS